MGSLNCAALYAALLMASAFASAEEDSPEPVRPSILESAALDVLEPLPSDTDLERRGARIGRVSVEVDEVFEDETQLSAPYRLVNSLHIGTRERTVRQQLLFQPGDAFERRLLDESARLLRGRRYLNEAVIEPTRYHEDDNTVDVLVRVHDVWTMSPGVSFGRKGGANHTRVEFEDTNFLGRGKQISLARFADVDRSAWRAAYVDPNVFGSWWQLGLEHSVLSDGSSDDFYLTRPFYSLDSRWSASLHAVDTEYSQARYSLGAPVERFKVHERSFLIGGGVSAGLQDGWATRYIFGLRLDEHRFALDPMQSDVRLPADRRFVQPYVGIEWTEDGYIRTRNLDQIGRTEDLKLGRRVKLIAGLATTQLGSFDDALLLEAEFRAGHELAHEQYLLNEVSMQTRFEHGMLRNSVLDVGSNYYRRHTEHRVLFVGFAARLTSHLDSDEQVLLGGDNGLRGYPLRYQAGTARALATFEERFYTKWQPLKLVNVGAAIFADAGRTWGRDDSAATSSGWLTDIGLGLRLGSVRSGLGNVLHIDIAFPLDRTGDMDGMQLSIETKRSF